MMDDTNQSNVINLSDRQRAAEELLRAKDNDRIAAQAIKDKAKAQREQDRLQREQDKLQQRAELKAAKLAADIEAREAEERSAKLRMRTRSWRNMASSSTL